VRDINGDHAQVRLYCAATLLQRLSTWIMLYRARVRACILSTNMVLVLVGFKLLRKTWLNEVNAPSADTHHIQHNTTKTTQYNTNTTHNNPAPEHHSLQPRQLHHARIQSPQPLFALPKVILHPPLSFKREKTLLLPLQCMRACTDGDLGREVLLTVSYPEQII